MDKDEIWQEISKLPKEDIEEIESNCKALLDSMEQEGR